MNQVAHHKTSSTNIIHHGNHKTTPFFGCYLRYVESTCLPSNPVQVIVNLFFYIQTIFNIPCSNPTKNPARKQHPEVIINAYINRLQD